MNAQDTITSHMDIKTTNAQLRSIAQVPVLSTLYLQLQDAIDAAPQRAVVYLNREVGMYQFSAIAATCKELRHVKELALGAMEVGDLELIVFSLGDSWMWYQG